MPRGYFREHVPVEDRFEKYVIRRDGCWGWSGCKDGGGYPMIALEYRNGKPRCIRAHRLAWQMVHGQIPERMVICHECDNPECTNPAHLFLGTRADNNRDRSLKGRNGKHNNSGEVNGQSKLTSEQVVEMRKLRAETGMTYKQIAAKYGTGKMAVYNAILGNTWGHIPGAIRA